MKTNNAVAWIGLVLLVVVLFFGSMFGFPLWNVWRAGLSGEAELKKAQQTRRILIEQAIAEKESSAVRAEAIMIIGKAAQDFPEYRHQEFLGAFAEALKEGKITQIMYIPTEANIPITEAHRLRDK
jgi:hypothetical protein